MATIGEIKRQAQKERRERLHGQFVQFQKDKFGRQLQVGDVLRLPVVDIINGVLDRHLQGQTHGEMIVAAIGRDRTSKVAAIGRDRTSKVAAIGLIHLHNNRTDADPHNNYCLSYGKTLLKRAVLVDTQQVVAQFGWDHQIGCSDIEPLAF